MFLFSHESVRSLVVSLSLSSPLSFSEDYIHRIGRTGRAGKKGVSHTYFHQGDKARAGELVNVLQVGTISYLSIFGALHAVPRAPIGFAATESVAVYPPVRI